MKTIDISVLIVNYNTAQLVLACVESVLKQRQVNMEIIVVDNNSQDESVALLQKHIGNQITLIANNDNRGFGAANNQAFRQSKGRYIFMLNPDAMLLTENDLAKAIAYMDRQPKIGLAGTRIINRQDEVEKTAFMHYPKQRHTQYDFTKLPGTIACVLGASMIARREAFGTIQGFDEDYFLYAEETDLCLRLRKSGYEIAYCEAVTVFHVGGASVAAQPSEQRIRRKKMAKYMFYSKHYPAHDVKRIAKHDYRLAKLHLFLLNIKKCFMTLTERERAHYLRHQIMLEVAQPLLTS